MLLYVDLGRLGQPPIYVQCCIWVHTLKKRFGIPKHRQFYCKRQVHLEHWARSVVKKSERAVVKRKNKNTRLAKVRQK
jgi:hypothetical protein